MRNIIALSVCLVPMMATAQVDETAMRALAEPIAMVLGAEEPCKIPVDRAAVDAYIVANVPPDAIMFADTLNGQTMLQEMTIKRMSEASLQAHCTTVRRYAESAGLTAKP